MDTIREWISALLLLLPGGAAARSIYCIIKMQMDGDQASIYKRRLIHLLEFTVIAMCVLGLLYCVCGYLGMGSGSSTHPGSSGATHGGGHGGF